MSDFSIRRAILAGPELARRRPLLLLVWGLLFLFLTLEAAWVIQARDDFMHARLLLGGGQKGRFVAPVLMLLGQGLLHLAVTSMIWASAFAALLRPKDPVALDLDLARGALTVFLASLVVQVMASLPIVLLSLVMFRLPSSLAPWLTLDSPVVLFIVGCGALWTAVASIVAFDQRRIAPFRCWAGARGRFWKLAGLYLTTALILLIVKLAPGAVMTVAGPQSAGEAHPWQTARESLATSQAPLHALAAPGAMALTLYSAAISAAEVALLAGIVATAYRAGTAKGAR